jgi:hypothetical protein
MYLIVESYFSEILLIVAAATQQLVATAFHEMALQYTIPHALRETLVIACPC